MDLTANICRFCCILHNKTNINHVNCQDEFTQIFLKKEDVEIFTSLAICKSCKMKLDEFKQFWQQFRRNINLLNVIKSEQRNNVQPQEPHAIHLAKSENNFPRNPMVERVPATDLSITITEADEKEVELEKQNEKIREAKMLEMKLLQQEERKYKPVKAIQLLEIYQNRITIQETTKYPESCLSQPVNSNITPDVSITMDTVNTPANENEHFFDEPVSPSTSTENNPTCSMMNPADLLNSEERRKHRNREASRRYRERAREDPELLKKMREQQNARQKKYYARLRMRKMNSGEWDNSVEDGQWSG